jgi:hypothetical protein
VHGHIFLCEDLAMKRWRGEKETSTSASKWRGKNESAFDGRIVAAFTCLLVRAPSAVSSIAPVCANGTPLTRLY